MPKMAPVLVLSLVVGIGAAVMFGTAQAQTAAYVTDQLEITLRSGQGNDYRILRMLPAGAELQVLERGSEWTRVQAGDQQGWVRSAYLQEQPAALTRLERASERLAVVSERNQSLNATVEELQATVEALTEHARELEQANHRMQLRLQEATEGLQLADENQALRKDLIDLEREAQDLRQAASRMADRSRQDWFIAGAGVIAAGMLIGILMTRIRWRRRTSWSDL